jgi:hypothetical protein
MTTSPSPAVVRRLLPPAQGKTRLSSSFSEIIPIRTCHSPRLPDIFMSNGGWTQTRSLRTRFLPFKDAIYRGERYLSDNDLFGEPARDEGRLPHEIASAVEFESGKDAEARIYAPLGIGNHVDHQLCYRAGVELARNGREVFFYEDLPYALIPGRATQRLDGVAEPLEIAAIADVTEVWQSKVEAIMAYPSQLGVIFEEYVGTGSSRDDIDQATAAYSRTVGEGVLAERFWRLGD